MTPDRLRSDTDCVAPETGGRAPGFRRRIKKHYNTQMFAKPTDAAIYAALPRVTDLTFMAQGSFKGVYRCKVDGKAEALKLIQIPSVPAGDDDAAEARKVYEARIAREIELLGKCKTPEIVKLGSLAPIPVTIETIEAVAYSEELLNGPTLWEIWRKKGPKPPEDEAKKLFLSLLKAIQEIWSFKVVHRDIKPCNVMKLADPDRQFVLLDLGIAFSRLDTALTGTGILPPATYRYFAPEMANPNFRDSLDFRSDLYTAALTVFEYTAQEHPLARDNDDLMASVSRAVKQLPKSLKECRPEFSDEFCKLIDQCLKKWPALRPANLVLIMRQLEGKS